MRERGNCGVLPPHPWVAADLASGDRTPQGIGFVVLGGVTSILGDGRAASQGEGSQSDSTFEGVKARRGYGTEPENPRGVCATSYGMWSSRMENPVVRKRHAGFGPAVEGEALVGNYRQAPHPTGIMCTSEASEPVSGSWRR
jgi:hypothetical protein